MDSCARSLPEDWQTLHGTLRDNLEQEIRLTRELLANMHQEELSLMLHDQGTLNQVLQQRYPMLEKLSFLRLERVETTQKIEKIAAKGDKLPTLEEILPPGEEISTEILSLSDQLMALTERMNRQHTQNQRLSSQKEGMRPIPLQPSPDVRPKRKASVATYNVKK